jgi:hypothetical protein
MEVNGWRDKVSAYAGGGVATNPTSSNMWEQVKNVFSYSDSVRRKMCDLSFYTRVTMHRDKFPYNKAN